MKKIVTNVQFFDDVGLKSELVSVTINLTIEFHGKRGIISRN